jgi:hypothetical protein
MITAVDLFVAVFAGAAYRELFEVVREIITAVKMEVNNGYQI